MNQEKRIEIIRTIMLHIYNGVGNQGDFLKMFARAFLLADGENIKLLYIPALKLIMKYHIFALQYYGDLTHEEVVDFLVDTAKLLSLIQEEI